MPIYTKTTQVNNEYSTSLLTTLSSKISLRVSTEKSWSSTLKEQTTFSFPKGTTDGILDTASTSSKTTSYSSISIGTEKGVSTSQMSPAEASRSSSSREEITTFAQPVSREREITGIQSNTTSVMTSPGKISLKDLATYTEANQNYSKSPTTSSIEKTTPSRALPTVGMEQTSYESSAGTDSTSNTPGQETINTSSTETSSLKPVLSSTITGTAQNYQSLSPRQTTAVSSVSQNTGTMSSSKRAPSVSPKQATEATDTNTLSTKLFGTSSRSNSIFLALSTVGGSILFVLVLTA